MLSIEKDQGYRKDGYVKPIWDYSVDYIGPADPRVTCAGCAARGTGRWWSRPRPASGWRSSNSPDVPAMQRLADKWQAVRGLWPFAVHQSWLFFGMFGSRAEELGLWAAYAAELPVDVLLRRLAERDFGPAAAPRSSRRGRT